LRKLGGREGAPKEVRGLRDGKKNTKRFSRWGERGRWEKRPTYVAGGKGEWGERLRRGRDSELESSAEKREREGGESSGH